MLYEKLKKYSKEGIYPFHMPGHKRTDITNEKYFPYELDLTEINGFDNLHNPTDLILSVQKLAQKLYSVKYAFMLINGATGGILSAIRSLTDYGDSVLVARNCHKSVYNAIEICGLNVKYILPDTDIESGIFCSISPQSVEAALNENTNIKAVIITSPTYEGVVSDIKSIAEICHKHNAKLFVDEAHGAHFPFSDFFPCEAVSCGADIAVVSLHKTLPSLTQTALLITNDDNICEYVSDNLSVFETSSPSYILISSIEKCFEYIIKNKSDFEKYKLRLSDFFNSTVNLKKLKVLCTDGIKDSFYDFDKSKIVILTNNSNINGFTLAENLRNKYFIETEMSYANYVIAMTSVCDTDDGFSRLKEALFDIDKQCNYNDKTNNNLIFKTYTNLPKKLFNSSSLYKHSKNTLKLNNSVGKASLEYVWAYPPGIPILVPGEIISSEIINYINYLLNNNINVLSTYKKLPEYITVMQN